MGIEVQRFALRELFLDNVGPFRGEMYSLSFRGHESAELANMFMIAAENGRGKTTVLEAIAFLVGLLDPGFDLAGAHWRPDEDSRMQLDIDLEIVEEDLPRQTLLSLTWGQVGPTGLNPQMGLQADGSLDEEDSERQLGAAQFGFCLERGRITRFRVAQRDESFDRLLDALCEEIGLAVKGSSYTGSSVTSLPSITYFCANRDIAPSSVGRALFPPERPRYRPLQRFSLDGVDRAIALEHLLVWLYWLDESRFTDIALHINKLVFPDLGASKYIRSDGLNKDTLQIEVVCGSTRHPLEALSSGEKSLVTLAARSHLHRTRNTVVLIDELELHLHPRFISRLVTLLKTSVAGGDACFVLFSTHSRDVVREFRFEEDEPHLVKGATVILPDAE